MAKTYEKLSAMAVARAATPGYYNDGAGLYLQVSKSGTKSWIFRFKIAGRSTEMGLGALHTITLAQARDQAKACRESLLKGINPLEARNAVKLSATLERSKAITFDQCAEAYISAHKDGWKHPKHVAQWQGSLSNYASPIIGDLPVASIDTPLVMKVLQPIWQTKTETATRVRSRIENILNWATVSKFRTGENPARWRGHLDHLLANPTKVAKVVHLAALPWQEIGAFIAELRQREGSGARALEFAVLTAGRSAEIRGVRWCEIDMDAALWTVPAERMKGGREHRVPLSTFALALLRSMPDVGEYIFPGLKGDVEMSNATLTAVLRRMGRDDITVHGFRSTFRDWCAESVGNSFPREVCEHALAHSLPDKVEAAYRRGDLIEKRKLLMQVWADYCAQPAVSASVTPLRKDAAA